MAQLLVGFTNLGFLALSSAFTSTGFDRHTSPVFSPANPESSVEDCLAHLGEKVSQELKEPLQTALQRLLSQWVPSAEWGCACLGSLCFSCSSGRLRLFYGNAVTSFLTFLPFFFCFPKASGGTDALFHQGFDHLYFLVELSGFNKYFHWVVNKYKPLYLSWPLFRPFSLVANTNTVARVYAS